MADNRLLNADKQTQLLTGSSTVERYDYKLENADFGTVSQLFQSHPALLERRTSVEICMNKLNALGGNLSTADIDICFQKLAAHHMSYYQ